jgi:pimeloyl-ACP methyl ester carboxylesterase
MASRMTRALWLSMLALACAHRREASVTCRDDIATERKSRMGIAYDVVGCGPAVLVIHGFSADRRMWQPLVARWRSAFRLVLVDLKSHGQSATATAADDPTAELLAVMDEAGVDRFAVIGHSAGAALAVDLASSAPARVTALVLLSPSVNGFAPSSARADLRELASRVRANDPPGAAEAWLASSVMQTALKGSARAAFRDMIRQNVRVWEASAGRPPSPRGSAADRIAAVQAPLLIAVGGQDASGVAEVADAIAAAHPRAPRRRLPDQGHWFPLEVPRAVATWTAAFLRAQVCLAGPPAGGQTPAGPNGRLTERSAATTPHPTAPRTRWCDTPSTSTPGDHT